MKLALKQLIFTFLLLFFGLKMKAQKIKVLNQKDKNPITSVFIYNLQKTATAITDSNGVAEITKFKKSDTLVFTHTSFKSFVIPFINVSNTIYLQENPFTLKQVEITAKQVREESLGITSTMDKIDAKTVALNTPQTSADMLTISGKVFIQKSQMGGGKPCY